MRWFAIILLFFWSCQKDSIPKVEIQKAAKPMVILVQPYKDISAEDVNYLTRKIKLYYPNVTILDPIDLPKNAYNKDRNRYRADTIIKRLAQQTDKGNVTIGLTTKDISVTKGRIKDFGIFGLGYRPGKSCVASKFRLDKQNAQEQLFKVAIHELGHTQGLKHCPTKNCFMRAAEGKNYKNEETGFCKKCKAFLITKHWKFS